MQITVYADFVCPWCYIGKRRLERAEVLWRAKAEAEDARLERLWRPFQLNPTMPLEGMERDAYLNWKLGGAERVAFIHDRLAKEGAVEGLRFAFDRIARMPNTLAAHRLLDWAQRRHPAAGDALAEALFAAYFAEGRDIGDAGTLADIADECDLPPAEAAAYLAGDSGLEAMREADVQARARGVNAVPCYVMGGNYALSGAQPPEVFLRMFEFARGNAA
ncbi:MAG: DsbA family oxidoreductase [Alphaproteobacteria bacterium]